LCEGRGRRDRHGKREGQALFLLRGNTIMLGGKKKRSARWEETNESRRYRDCIHDGGKPGSAHEGSRRVPDGEGGGRGRRMPRATVSLIKVSMMSVD